MLIEIPDEVIENWREELTEMEDIYADQTRNDYWDADDIAIRTARQLKEIIDAA